MLRFVFPALVLLAGAFVYAQPAGDIERQAALIAPTGTLRAAYLPTNPVHGRRDPVSGTLSGPVADLVKELARRLNVPYTMVPLEGRAMMEQLRMRTLDIGFLAYNAARAAEADFSKPFALMPNTYLVRARSPIRSIDSADRKGARIAVVTGDTQDVYLSANLKNAALYRLPLMPPHAELNRMLESGEVEAFGINRQRALDAVAQSPNLRALEEDFFVAEQCVIVAKGDRAKLEVMNRFVDQVTGSGFIRASLERAKLAGVYPPGAAKR